MKKLLGLFLLLSAFFVASGAQAATDIDPLGSASSCTNLTYDLRVQSTDAQTGGQVSRLQFFLQSEGYLNSEPTGYFGLLTFAAVQKFQAASGITPTSGFVGPLTRTKINAQSCDDSDDEDETTPTIPGGTSSSGSGNPSLTLTGRTDDDKSTTSITVDVGEKITISGKPQNLDGLDNGDDFSAAWYFGSVLRSCSNNSMNSSVTWKMTCTADMTGTTNVYVLITKDGRSYVSNTLRVTVVDADDEDEDEDEEESSSYRADLSVSPSSGAAPLEVVFRADMASFLKRVWNSGTAGTVVVSYGNGEEGTICKTASSGVAGCSSSMTLRHTYYAENTYTAKLIFRPADGGRSYTLDSTTVEAGDDATGTPVIYGIIAKGSGAYEGPAGSTIVLTGKNFGDSKSALKVYFGGVRATVSKLEDDAAWVTVPSVYPTTYGISVENKHGRSGTIDFRVTSASSSDVYITLTNPDNGTTWRMGDTEEFTWKRVGIDSDAIGFIELIDSRGGSYPLSDIPNTGKYRWKVGNMKGGMDPGEYSVRIGMGAVTDTVGPLYIEEEGYIDIDVDLTNDYNSGDYKTYELDVSGGRDSKPVATWRFGFNCPPTAPSAYLRGSGDDVCQKDSFKISPNRDKGGGEAAIGFDVYYPDAYQNADIYISIWAYAEDGEFLGETVYTLPVHKG